MPPVKLVRNEKCEVPPEINVLHSTDARLQQMGKHLHSSIRKSVIATGTFQSDEK